MRKDIDFWLNQYHKRMQKNLKFKIICQKL